jgi:hypothetical protein
VASCSCVNFRPFPPHSTIYDRWLPNSSVSAELDSLVYKPGVTGSGIVQSTFPDLGTDITHIDSN